MRILGIRVGAVEAIMALCAIAFIATMAFPVKMAELFAVQPQTLFAKPWTAITSMFLHADVMHIFFNMMALYFFGLYLERLQGEGKMLKIFFLGGIAGSLLFTATSLFFNSPPSDTIAVCASDGIFAIAGALAILQPNMQIIMFPIFIPMPLYIAVFVFMVLLSFMPGVAWQGHLGGLIIGAIYGFIWKRKSKEITALHTKYGYRFV